MKPAYYSLISFLAILLASRRAKEKTTGVSTNVAISVVTEPVQLSSPHNSFIQETQNKRKEMTSTPDASDTRINSTRRKQLASERAPSF